MAMTTESSINTCAQRLTKQTLNLLSLNPNPNTKQHVEVSIHLHIFTHPTYPEKFIRYDVIAQCLLLSVVIVTLPSQYGNKYSSKII